MIPLKLEYLNSVFIRAFMAQTAVSVQTVNITIPIICSCMYKIIEIKTQSDNVRNIQIKCKFTVSVIHFIL